MPLIKKAKTALFSYIGWCSKSVNFIGNKYYHSSLRKRLIENIKQKVARKEKKVKNEKITYIIINKFSILKLE